MNFLVFSDQQAALDADVQIFAAMVTDHKGDGGKSDAQGLIGRDKNGVEKPDKTRTIRWAIPAQRLDGEWTLLHPENYIMTKRPGKHGLIAKMLRGLNSVPVDEYSDDWFASENEQVQPVQAKTGKGRLKE